MYFGIRQNQRLLTGVANAILVLEIDHPIREYWRKTRKSNIRFGPNSIGMEQQWTYIRGRIMAGWKMALITATDHEKVSNHGVPLQPDDVMIFGCYEIFGVYEIFGGY